MRHPPVTPRQHRQWHRIEIETLVGEAVLVSCGAHLVDVLRDDPVLDKASQPLRENVARDAQALAEFVEPM